MAMFYDNQKIEIGDSNEVKIFDVRNKAWRRQKIDYDKSQIISIYGLDLPIMLRNQLID